MNIVTLFVFAGLGVTIGDLILCYWAKTGNLPSLILGLLFNIIGIIFYANTLKLETVGIATTIFLASNIVAVTVLGILFYNESVSWMQVGGIVLILFAIVLIEI